MNRFRAFIGPLGDDIPSIFPIVAGILIFLIAMGFIQQQVAARNEYVDLRDQVLQLSYIATEKGFMPDNAFDATCLVVKETGEKRQVNFTMILKKFCGPVDAKAFFDLDRTINPPSHPVEHQDRVCSRWTHHQNLGLGSAKTLLEFPDENTVIMSYPMAVSCAGGARGLGFLSIAGWR